MTVQLTVYSTTIMQKNEVKNCTTAPILEVTARLCDTAIPVATTFTKNVQTFMSTPWSPTISDSDIKKRGAYNIIAAARYAVLWTNETFGATPWTGINVNTECDAPCGGLESCYDSTGNVIELGKNPAYSVADLDDVFFHEFGHFWAHHEAIPLFGGSHEWCGQIDPRLALSEGLAHSAAAQIKTLVPTIPSIYWSVIYLNPANLNSTLDLEEGAICAEHQNNELAVAGVFYDLYDDATPTESFDQVSGQTAEVWSSLFGFTAAPLDAWFHAFAAAHPEVAGQIAGHYSFPFEVDGVLEAVGILFYEDGKSPNVDWSPAPLSPGDLEPLNGEYPLFTSVDPSYAYSNADYYHYVDGKLFVADTNVTVTVKVLSRSANQLRWQGRMDDGADYRLEVYDADGSPVTPSYANDDESASDHSDSLVFVLSPPSAGVAWTPECLINVLRSLKHENLVQFGHYGLTVQTAGSLAWDGVYSVDWLGGTCWRDFFCLDDSGDTVAIDVDEAGVGVVTICPNSATYRSVALAEVTANDTLSVGESTTQSGVTRYPWVATMQSNGSVEGEMETSEGCTYTFSLDR